MNRLMTSLTISAEALMVTVSLLCGTTEVTACGPYFESIPTPCFMAEPDVRDACTRADEDANIQLWLDVTSPDIPADDIRYVVYEMRADRLENAYDNDTGTCNAFIRYLRDNEDREVLDFLLLAKQLQTMREERNSPWYYPADRETDHSFDTIVERCNSYDGVRLRDRYALQGVRALFAAQQYSECVGYFSRAFGGISDTNLFKRMATGYVAGCLSRLGRTDEADEFFAAVGDMQSLSCSDKIGYMATRNPDAPQLIAALIDKARYAENFKQYVPLIRSVLGDDKVTCRGDWEFMLAYACRECDDDVAAARRHIRRALGSSFSSVEMRDHAHAYAMKLDGLACDDTTLLTDLQWIESRLDGDDAAHWIDIFKNIVLSAWVPSFWHQGRYTDAVLIARYADCIGCDGGDKTPSTVAMFNIGLENDWDGTCQYSPSDHGNVSFLVANSLSSGQLEGVIGDLFSDTPLYRHLRHRVDLNLNYYYELLGTILMREGDYRRAAHYLSMVGVEYQTTLAIFKGNYLNIAPFVLYEGEKWEVTEYGGYTWISHNNSCGNCPVSHGINAKLHFASEMAALRERIDSDAPADVRALALIRYSIGRFNSFEDCWALTQYQRGFVTYNPADEWYGADDGISRRYTFIYDYGYEDYLVLQREYDRNMARARSMMTTDEGRARAEYMLGNLRTVIHRYNNTRTAAHIRSSCDNWNDWL